MADPLCEQSEKESPLGFLHPGAVSSFFVYIYIYMLTPPPHDPRFCFETDGSWEERGL